MNSLRKTLKWKKAWCHAIKAPHQLEKDIGKYIEENTWMENRRILGADSSEFRWKKFKSNRWKKFIIYRILSSARTSNHILHPISLFWRSLDKKTSRLLENNILDSIGSLGGDLFTHFPICSFWVHRNLQLFVQIDWSVYDINFLLARIILSYFFFVKHKNTRTFPQKIDTLHNKNF